MVPNLGPPYVLGLQLQEIFLSLAGGFWEFSSKNIQGAKVGNQSRQMVLDDIGHSFSIPFYAMLEGLAIRDLSRRFD